MVSSGHKIRHEFLFFENLCAIETIKSTCSPQIVVSVGCITSGSATKPSASPVSLLAPIPKQVCKFCGSEFMTKHIGWNLICVSTIADQPRLLGILIPSCCQQDGTSRPHWTRARRVSVRVCELDEFASC